MVNQVFVPTVAKFKDDIKTSLKIQDPLVAVGYKGGLMLVIQKGFLGGTEDAEKQYANLREVFDADNYGDSPIVTMLSNMPIDQIDFLHNSEFAVEHVRRGIDFAHGLPIGKRKILTFHLNTLVTGSEFRSKDEIAWRDSFHKEITPCLEKISRYALHKGVEVKIETVPVPEFGDISSSDTREYRTVKLSELMNPFYLTSYWGFEQVRDAGLGICLDLCHNRAIYEVAKKGDLELVLHPSDRTALSFRTLYEDVVDIGTEDLVHLNDGDGIYSNVRNKVFREGVQLGQGDITCLRAIINHLDSRKIPYVLEINETDFVNRPNTKGSIEYLLQK